MNSLGYYDINNYETGENPNDKLPFRKRNRTHRMDSHDKWKDACLGLNPDFDSLSETAKEMIETKLQVEYYISLGLNTSIPRTATSGSIQTPRVSPLVKRPPRVPSRAPSAPLIPSRHLAPIGPLPPLPIQHSLAYRTPVSPIPSFQPLPSVSSLSPLNPLMPNPYLSSFYHPQDKNTASSSSTSLIEDLVNRQEPKRFYDPTATAFSATKLAESASSSVDGIYKTRNPFYDNINEPNNNNTDEPIDYSIDSLNQWGI